jgi:hypothetical protein
MSVIRIASLALILVIAVEAQGRGFGRAPAASYSYYPPAVVLVPVQPLYSPLVCLPAGPQVPPRIYATPTPAPPLGQPQGKPATPPPAPPPGVKESRSFFDAYALAGPAGQPVNGLRCQVGFWNNTEQDLVVTVDGQARTLVRGKGVTLELPRSFVWQVDGREPRSERVPAEQAGLEIVIRR